MRNDTGQILTIGYAEKDAEERIAAFLRQENAVLVDIRKMPKSRYYWRYNETRMQGLYSGQYIHIPALGNANYRPENRKKGIALVNPEAGIKQVCWILNKGYSLILLCACKEYERCHRKTVYDLITATLARNESEPDEKTQGAHSPSPTDPDKAAPS